VKKSQNPDEAQVVEEEQKEEDQVKKNSELDKALAKGSIQLAPSKEQKNASSAYSQLVTKKGKK